MKKTAMWLLAILVFAGCSKKKAVPEGADDASLPLIIGRNIDSLSRLSYEPRILAFSIELGHRNVDFDKRLGLMIGEMTPDRSWRDVVEKHITSPNYHAAESYNRLYLDSLALLLHDPPAHYAASQEALKQALLRLIANYDVLRRYDGFPSMSAILDTILNHERAINQTITDFKNQIEAVRRSPPP